MWVLPLLVYITDSPSKYLNSYTFESKTVNCTLDSATSNCHCAIWVQENNLNLAGEGLRFGEPMFKVTIVEIGI